MVELLIYMKDRINPKNPNITNPRRGDVIIANPDGFQWGVEERTNPLFRVVRVPGLTVSTIESLIAQEPGDSDLNSNLNFRNKHIDVDALVADIPRIRTKAVHGVSLTKILQNIKTRPSKPVGTTKLS